MTLSLRKWVLSASLLATCSLANAQSVEENLRRADKQFNLYAYNLALTTYKSVVEAQPTNTYALGRLADCLVQLNRPDEALAWYDRATGQNDVQPDVFLHFGQALMASGNYVAAKKWFVFYQQTNPELGKHYAELCDYATFNSGKEALYQANLEPMNSPAADFGAAFNGNRIVFSSARSDMARNRKYSTSEDWSGGQSNQLFATVLDAKGNLQKPAFLKSDLGNEFNQGPVAYSADGKRVAFCKNNFVDGSRQIAETGLTMSLYTADVEANGEWYNIKAFPYNGSQYATGYPNFSPDGSLLFFASNRPDGNGGWDIYSTTWTGKNWTSPSNLGRNVNSPGNEITPFYDGRNLFFSSDWWLGFGGMDVFRAETEGGIFSKIFHLGPGINSSRDDYGFIFNASENLGYLTSNRASGKGNEDIYRISKKTDDFTVTVWGADQKPLADATIDFTACGGGATTTDASGKFSFSVAAGKTDCEATVRKQGYRDATASIKSGGAKNVTVVLEQDGMGKFVGKVASWLTNQPVSDVIVRALPMPSGNVLTATTSIDGSYTLLLEARKSYKLQFTKLGFLDTMVNLATGEPKFTNAVEPMLLRDEASAKANTAATTPAPAPAVYSFTKPNTPAAPAPSTTTLVLPKAEMPPAQVKSAENETAAPVPTAYSFPKAENPAGQTTAAKAAPTTPSPVLSSLKPELKLSFGWAIQISALGGTATQSQLDKFDNLSNLGYLYTVPAGSVTKVRLGVYAYRSDAEAVLKKVVALKYKKPFIVEEKSIDESLIIKDRPAATASTSTGSNARTGATVAPQPAQPRYQYGVQIAALRSDESINFADYQKVSDIGNLYTRAENGLTKIRVGVWNTADDAELARAAILRRGFANAVVVIEQNNQPAPSSGMTPRSVEPTVRPYRPATTPQAASTPNALVRPYNGGATNPAAYNTGNSNYRVRIATYVDAYNFDPNVVRGVAGKLESRKEGAKTVFIMTGYPDLESCLAARDMIRNIGYRDAQVAKEENGKLIKLNY